MYILEIKTGVGKENESHPVGDMTHIISPTLQKDGRDLEQKVRNFCNNSNKSPQRLEPENVLRWFSDVAEEHTLGFSEELWSMK